METTYNLWLVALSICVAITVSFTALKLAARVAHSPSSVARVWLIAGGISMGVGIWSMHFIGMLAFSLPIKLTYSIPITLISLGIAILISCFALAIASGTNLTARRLCLSSLVLGLGITAMHYSGMAAIRVTPLIDYDPGLVLASIVIAITASFAGLWLAFRLKSGDTRLIMLARLGAAIIMGVAISGMHYTAMAASMFSLNSICTGGVALDATWFAVTLGLLSLALLAVTLITALFDANLDSRIRAHAKRLEQANADLRYQATHDALTGLPNRGRVMERIREAIARYQDGSERFAVLAIGLDRFKAINDSLGHAVGDDVLRESAKRMLCVLHSADVVARMGGDEFVVIMRDARTREAVGTAAANILKALSTPYHGGGVELHVTPSIGVSIYPDDAPTAEALVSRADEAMYSAKRDGGSAFQFFSANMSVFTQERLEFENDLRRAVERNQFELYYQPQVDVASGRIVGLEALIRWSHPTRGLIYPDSFIDLAEETGLIVPIGTWVLQQAVRQLRQWHRSGLTALRMAVNVSAVQFRQPDLMQTIAAVLSENHIPAPCLEVEVTESAVMTDAERSAATLMRLRDMGVQVAIDDFGTGYSCLDYLKRFPLSKLKVDRCFITDLCRSTQDESIVRAILSLGHSLNLHVVAEGVEMPAQLERLRQFGCDEYQGYLCSRPRPASQIELLFLGDATASYRRPASATALA
jgi:diguanylate cyclase (GGDEF)-like protein